jgi:hypothetical protein
MHIRQNLISVYTVKKEKKIFLIYKDIQKGSGAKSYMRKGFPIYEEMCKYLVIYEEAVSHIGHCTRSLLNFFIYEDFFSTVNVENYPSQSSCCLGVIGICSYGY